MPPPPTGACASPTSSTSSMASVSATRAAVTPAARGNGYVRSFRAIPAEHGFTPLRVDGEIPRALDGTLYRNGPGLFGIGEHAYRHWFDGDGLVTALRVRNGSAEGAARLVQTAGLREERARGRAYFGSYGTKAPGRFFNPWRALRSVREGGKNPANTSMLAWRERLFALCEVGLPVEIDPETLMTIGDTDLDGAVSRAFSAHPHRIAKSGAIYNVGTRIGRPNELEITVLRPDGTAARVTSVRLDHPTMVHDFALTERHLVVFVAPLEIALFRVLFGGAAFADAHQWRPERGTEVIVVPLDAPSSPVRFRTDAFWAWHVANAFERGSGAGSELVIDVVRYDSYPATARWLEGIPRGAPIGEADGYLERVVLDPRRRTLRHERRRDRTGEFPRVAPSVDAARYRALYQLEHSSADAGRRGPPDTIVRVDVEAGTLDEHRFAPHEWPSEAVFVPRPGSTGETDGWLVSLVYDADADTSAWWIFDAAHVSDGPLGRAWLEHHVPLGFHGAWRPRT